MDDKPKLKLVTDPSEYEQPAPEHNVVQLGVVTTLDLSADQVLQAAMGKLDGVVILGYTKGDRGNRSASDEYFASSIAAGDTVVWLLERAKFKLMMEGECAECDIDDYPA